MKNYLNSGLKISWMVIGGLFLLSLLPNIAFLRPIRLLSDVIDSNDYQQVNEFQADEVTDALNEELALIDANDAITQEVPEHELLESWYTKHIIDYNRNEEQGMSLFFDKLSHISTRKYPLRIAIMGDSYFQTDAFSGSLRESLQKRYGGTGIGYISIMPTNKKGYRPPLYHLIKGWTRHSSTQGYSDEAIGIDGHFFKPSKGARVFTYTLKDNYSRIASCKSFSLYFINHAPIQLGISINEAEQKIYDIEPSNGLNQLTINATIDSIRWQVLTADSATFYAMSMDDFSGICLDDLSKENATGTYLRHIPDWILDGYNKIRPYDLVILQYGSLLPANTNLASYKKEMNIVIDHLKRNMPNTTFLLISAGSQAIHKKGKTNAVAMKEIVDCQQQIAAENGIAFWNLYHVMGGEEAMIKLINAKQASITPNGIGLLNSSSSISIAKRFLESLNEQQIEYEK